MPPRTHGFHSFCPGSQIAGSPHAVARTWYVESGSKPDETGVGSGEVFFLGNHRPPPEQKKETTGAKGSLGFKP